MKVFSSNQTIFDKVLLVLEKILKPSMQALTKTHKQLNIKHYACFVKQ